MFQPQMVCGGSTEAHVLGSRVALSGDREGAEEPGRGWRVQANLKRKEKEELRKKRWSCRQSWGDKVWVALLSHPLLQPRSSPSCAELYAFAVTLMCANNCHAWHALTLLLLVSCLVYFQPGQWAGCSLEAQLWQAVTSTSHLDQEHIVVGQWQGEKSISG